MFLNRLWQKCPLSRKLSTDISKENNNGSKEKYTKQSVICFQVLLNCLWGFLFKNMMVGYMVNFAYWLFSIVVATASPTFSFLARYDAANSIYNDLSKYLNTGNTAYLSIGGNLVYSIGVITVVIGIAYLFRTRWEKNGI